MPTGFIQPQATEANPFRATQPTGFSPFGQTSPLQPAPTGVNPFSAQNGFPGTNAFSNNPFPGAAPASNPFPSGSNANPFGAINGSPFANASSPNSQPSTHLNPFPSQQTRSVSQPFSFASPNQPTATNLSSPTAPTPAAAFNPTTAFSVPARPASTPLTQTQTSSPSIKPLKAHQTGSRNPFGVPKAPSPPPVPRAPTLFELANGVPQNQPPAQSPIQVQPQQTGAPATTFTSVASSFLSGSSSGSPPPVPQLTTTSFNALGSGTSASTPTSTTTGSTFSDSLFGSANAQPTGSSSGFSNSQPTGSPLRPQATGYSAGIKAFKPSSSFGASLLESLPPISAAPENNNNNNASASPAGGNFNLSAQQTGFPSTGSSVGVGLRPQAANAGVVNPFRASMFTQGGAGPGPGPAGAFGAPSNAAAGAGAGASLFLQPTGGPAFGQNFFGGGLQADVSKQQNGAASFI